MSVGEKDVQTIVILL